MSYINTIKALIKRPYIFKPLKRILLVSHMRGNTSLFSHLLGSSNEIEGYYELHVSYRSYNDLMLQKLKYYTEHTVNTNATYFFDKVLHNHHDIKTTFVDNFKIIIMVREPYSTISSIMKLYRERDAAHVLASLNGASQYYEDRLKKLKMYAVDLDQKFFFLKAEDLIDDTDELLEDISEWLSLRNKLTSEYKINKKTGVKGAGDSSMKMKSGKVIPRDTSKEYNFTVDESILELYNETVGHCIRNSINHKQYK
jgi:hypothetical protein